VKKNGFTLIELMVVVVIIGITAALSYIKINSRMMVSRLENFTQTLVSDLDYARSTAMLKGCPLRLVFCQDPNCTSLSNGLGNVADGEASVIGLSSDATFAPATHYAFLRMSQLTNVSAMCFNDSAVVGTVDGFDFWDFDRRPQPIPQGIVMRGIYTTTGLVNSADWSDTTSADAAASIWFNSEGRMTVPLNALTTTTSAMSYQIVFQTSLGTCDAASGADDCLGFLIATPQAAGQARLVRCSPGGVRNGATPSDVCF
jgi:prepilin-type N-terminal cleavage/methylation domain-containing protein